VRFVIYGAGAIGGAIGGCLFRSGHDVTLIARGAHARALRDRGLTLRSAEGSDTLPVPVAGHPGEARLRDGDVVVLAMKSQDTAAAVEALARCAPPGIAVACAQNGVENERIALRAFADVYGVNVYCPATHLEPGVVLAFSSPVTGILDVGRYPAGTDDTARAVAAALEASTFRSDARPDILRWKYNKLLLNLGNAVDAVCDARRAEGDDREAAAELVRLVRAEGEACLAAAGIDAATEHEFRERRGDLLAIRPIEGAPRSGSSSWQSLARGTGSIESDYLNGEVVLLGRLHGVATPANALLQRLAREVAAEGGKPGARRATDVLAGLVGGV
jgi:2-dehydropantoate 2-reductase